MEPMQKKTETRDHAKVKIFPPLALAITLLGVRMLDKHAPWDMPPLDSLRFGSYLLMPLGFALVLLAVRELKKAKTHVNPFKTTKTIVGTGPFRFSRNPIYLGFLIFVLGFGLFHATWWALIGVTALFLILHFMVVIPEEEYLAEKFNQQYIYYANRVRRWF